MFGRGLKVSGPGLTGFLWFGACMLMASLALAQGDEAPVSKPPAARAVPEPPANEISPSPGPDVPAGVTPPVLETFIEAQYPQAAGREGREGHVVLALDIDRQGRVTRAEVVEAAGHGFDEAARAAALQFVFEPAMRNGKAVPSRILYRYSFALKPDLPEATTAASVLTGEVRAADTGRRIAGARVRLRSKNRLVGELVTGRDGIFRFTELEAGTYQLEIEANGFRTFTVQERLDKREEASAVYRMATEATAGSSSQLGPGSEGEVAITVQGERPAREVTRRTVTRRELSRVPGTSGDALRALQNLPGVARPPSLSGVLAVRGVRPEATLVFVEGVYLPDVYHFGGLSSVVPTEMIDDIDFFPGNYSVRYGRALGGVVDVTLRKTRDDGRYHGLLQVDLLDARALFEGPLPLVKKWNVIAGFRRSHVDTWLVPLVESNDTDIVAAPVYYDYQLLADTRPTADSYLRLGLMGFDDRLRIVNTASAEGGELDSANAFWGVAALYEKRFSEAVQAKTTLTVGRLRERVEISTIAADTRAYGIISRGELGYRFWPNASLRFGHDVLIAPFTLEGQIPEDPGPSAPDVGSFITRPMRQLQGDGLFFQPAIYAEFDVKPNRRAQLLAGVRGDYFNTLGRVDISPRISARYDLAMAPRTTIKAASGLFQQAPDLGILVLKAENTGLLSERSFQNSIGLEQELSERVELSAEAFFNLLDDLVSRRADPDGVLRYNSLGRGRVFGLELLLRYEADEDFFGWISYTLSRSERTFNPGEETRLFGLDQPHILTALGSYRLGKGWELGARFRYVSGNLYTPCEGGIFSSVSTEYLCLNAAFNSARLPPFHQLDVRLDKRWTFSGFELGAYLDLINVYNRTNPDFISYNFDYSQSRPQSASLPIVPSLGIRGEF